MSCADLFVRVHVDVALDAFLPGVGPAVARHPLPFAARTLVLAKTSLLTLIRRHHRLRSWSCRNTLHHHHYHISLFTAARRSHAHVAVIHNNHKIKYNKNKIKIRFKKVCFAKSSMFDSAQRHE